MSDLQEFDANRECNKCGETGVSARYYKGIHHPGCSISRACGRPDCCKLEHLERYCRRCGYGWAEKVLEAENED